MKSYQLYLITSSQELPELLDCLYSFSEDLSNLGPIRKVFYREGNSYSDAGQRIVCLHPNIYNVLQKEGFASKNNYDFLIEPYLLQKWHYPPENATYHYFVEPSKKNILSLQQKLEYLGELFQLSKKEWKICKNGMVRFEEAITPEIRVLWKILLDDPEEYRVSWYKKR